jgi:hypothetical protein
MLTSEGELGPLAAGEVAQNAFYRTSARFSKKCDSVETANEMSVRVATEAYMRLPIASLYGTFFIRIDWGVVLGIRGVNDHLDTQQPMNWLQVCSVRL